MPRNSAEAGASGAARSKAEALERELTITAFTRFIGMDNPAMIYRKMAQRFVFDSASDRLIPEPPVPALTGAAYGLPESANPVL